MGDEYEIFVDAITMLPASKYRFSVQDDPDGVAGGKAIWLDISTGVSVDRDDLPVRVTYIVRSNRGPDYIEIRGYNLDTHRREGYMVALPAEAWKKVFNLWKRTPKKGLGTNYLDLLK